jgi:hypothetical protein
VIIETGSSPAVPLADWVADLYVVTDAIHANVESLSGTARSHLPGPDDGHKTK